LEAFFWTLLPNFPGPPVLLHSRGHHFMDKPDNVISLINLATVRALEALWRTPIDPLRFRANLYIDGARPWEEFDWVGRDIRIGGVTFSVDRKNGRCGATNVNPVTGQRDLDIPGSLRVAFGRKKLGVYLIARESGASPSATPSPRRATVLCPPKRSRAPDWLRPGVASSAAAATTSTTRFRRAAASCEAGHDVQLAPLRLALPGLRDRQVDLPTTYRNGGLALSTSHRIALHASWISRCLHAIFFARGGDKSPLRPVRSDLDDMPTFLQFADGGVRHSVFNDKHAGSGGTGPERRGKMLTVPCGSVDRFLEIVGSMNVAEEELWNPLVLLVSTW
jgi:hypothetical protein